MNDWWILDENDNPIRENDYNKVEDFFQSNRRKIKLDVIGYIRISTVFLCLDHSYTHDRGLPLLYETMIFGGDHDLYQARYTTKTEALIGHEKALELVKRSLETQ